ncbi:hypothetical protein [Duganella callida]|uniref:Uncharacterized protein n=1 Tax=Duganella callida TaxID=2561932 RepID=A0A4Y9S2Z5_9BURK|nr:hypothetical protein [Duganella callida]TFW14841.1 hypothetical protein E4L98_27395 [Duganella callida]
MITLPEHVLASTVELEGHAWDGQDAVSGHDNLQSSMDWAEHQRIVCNARTLLQGEPPGNAEVRKIFNELKSAYEDKAGRTVVRVSKGIHQPTVNPHIQLRTITDYGDQISYHKFHLNVSAKELPPTENLADDIFQWEPVQFSFLHTNGQTYNWPALASAPTKKGALKRRQSISAAGLQAHIDEQLKIKQAAAKQEADDAFDKAIQAFHEAYGTGKTKVVRYSNAGKDGVFPNANFKKGSNATVTISTQSRPTVVHYDATRKVVVLGPRPK